MPSHSQQTVKGPAKAPPPGPEVAAPAADRGNAAAQDKLVAADAGDAGLANYQAALGDFLGGELYKAVSGALAWGKVEGYAKSALHGALEGLAGQVDGLDGVEADPKALETLVAALEARLGPLVDAYLEGDGKELHGKLTGWVGANPRTVALTALLAAAGAVLANVPLPELKKKFKLGEGLDAELDAKLGKIRSLSLQKIRARVSYEAGPLAAAVQVTHEGGETTGDLKASLGGDGRKVSLDAKMDADGLKVVGLDGELDAGFGKLKGDVSKARDKDVVGGVSLIRQDGKTTRTDDFRYDAGSGVLTIGTAAVWKDGDLSVSQGAKWGSDGTGEFSTSVSGKRGGFEGSLKASHSTTKGAYGLSEEDKLSFGMKYSREDLKVQLDAALATGGKSSLAISGEKDLGGDWRVGGDAKLGDGKLMEAGAFYGFRDPKEFKTFLLDYRYKAAVDEHTFGMLVERQFGSILARYEQKATWGTGGSRLDTSIHAAKYIDADTALIAGGHHYKDFTTDKNSFKPEIGVQYKGVPVLVGYDTDRKAVTIGVTIPFGR